MIDISEVEPGYWVDRLGNVFSEKSGRYLTPQTNMKGYRRVKLTAGKWRLIHRLVASAFVAGNGAGMEVNHKDGFKTHNWYENLEWVTHSGNMQHAWRTGLASQTEAMRRATSSTAKRLNPLKRKLSNAEADQIRRRHSGGELQYVLALEFNVSKMTISKLVRGINYAT